MSIPIGTVDKPAKTGLSTLTETQKSVIDALMLGKNIFLTGGGGTGKSHLISVINQEFPDMKSNYLGIPYRIQTTALTGCAAILLGTNAKTLHSWAGIGLGRGTAEELAEIIRKKKTKAKKAWNQTDLLIIDEISMMPAELLEKLNKIGQIVRKSPRPFGGIQLLLVGDFYQLPPVIRDTSGSGIMPTEVFAFQSSQWTSIVDVTIELKTIHRQQDDVFRKILTEARSGILSRESIEILKSRIGIEWRHLKIKPTLLFPRKAEVDKINEANLASLTGERQTYVAGFQTAFYKVKPAQLPFGTVVLEIEDNYTYCDGLVGFSKEASDEFTREIDIMDRDSSYLKEVEIAIDAQVMLIVNLDMSFGLVNGSRGVVVGYTAGKTRYPIVEFLNGEKRVMSPHRWLVEEYSTKERKIYRTQVPLRLAYALTIHKSQGASLDSALIDIGSNTFEYGQAYVALSRVRSLDSLYIHAFESRAVKAHPRVKDFYTSMLDVDMAAGGAGKSVDSPTPHAITGGAGKSVESPVPDVKPSPKLVEAPVIQVETKAKVVEIPIETNWLFDSIPGGWKHILKSQEKAITSISKELDAIDPEVKIFPARENIWSALEYIEPEKVRVVILGQDPYPTEGNAHGLAFSVQPEVKPLPASLKNIYKELESDLGVEPPKNGSLVEWAKQGVLLLNTILTVKESSPLSHSKLGWEPITDTILQAVAKQSIIVLWGKNAQDKKKVIPAGCTFIEAPHPSPLSAHRGFFGSKPFTKINEYLSSKGEEIITWV
jgi:ATP-dependent DNA helicase PIF1